MHNICQSSSSIDQSSSKAVLSVLVSCATLCVPLNSYCYRIEQPQPAQLRSAADDVSCLQGIPTIFGMPRIAQLWILR